MYYSVHNFDYHKQKLDRSCSLQSEDVAQRCTYTPQKLIVEESNIFQIAYYQLPI